MNGNQLSNNVSLLLGTVGAVLGIGTIYLQSKHERAAHKAARSQYAQQPPTAAESPVPEPAHETPKIADSKEAKPAPKPKKRTMEKRVVKPFLPGDSVVFAQHMYDAKAPPLEIRVSNDDLQYNLRPKYLPAKKEGDPPIVYLDAEDPGFFERPLAKPLLRCWILINGGKWGQGGYVKRRLAEEMRRQNIEVQLISPHLCDLLVSKDGLQNIVYAGVPIGLPDCVIPRLGAVVDYFGLAIMRQLETLNVLMFNPTQSIEISRDKLFTHQIMATHGVPIPKTVLGRKPVEYDFIKKHFGYPVIVKLTSGSKGNAVWKVDTEEELRALMRTLEDSTTPIIFQEFLAATKGRDLRCVVIGDKLVASMMRIAKSGFKANVHQGGSVKVITVKKSLEDLVIKTTKLCHLDFSGVDLLMDRPGYKVCEVNSSPGFEGLERATHIDVAKQMVNYIKQRVLQRRAEGGRKPPEDMVNIPLQDDHVEELRDQALRTPLLGPMASPLDPTRISIVQWSHSSQITQTPSAGSGPVYASGPLPLASATASASAALSPTSGLGLLSGAQPGASQRTLAPLTAPSGTAVPAQPTPTSSTTTTATLPKSASASASVAVTSPSSAAAAPSS